MRLSSLGLATCVALSGCDCGDQVGRLHPRIAASSVALDFGSVALGQSSTRALLLRAVGSGPVRLTSLRIGDPAFRLNGGSALPELIGAGVELPLELSFTPPRVGSTTTAAQLSNDSENQPELTVALSGRGIDCDDHDPCTTDFFSESEGRCRSAPYVGPCDDGDACTEDDRCAADGCHGTPIRCDDAIDCTRDLCDREVGCLHLPDSMLCGDGNVCTDDVCEVGVGCVNPPVRNGTPCGSQSCAGESLCIGGDCRPGGPPPDGAGCDDQQICTVGDACHAGACQGLPSHGAHLIAELPSFGARGGSALMLGEGRMIFADSYLDVNDWRTGPRWMTLVERRGTSLHTIRSSSVSGVGALCHLHALGADRFIAIDDDAKMWSFQIDPTGRISSLGSFQLPNDWAGNLNCYSSSAVFGSVLYNFVGPGLTGRLQAYDLQDPRHPVLAFDRLYAGQVFQLEIDRDQSALVLLRIDGLEWWSLANPLAPEPGRRWNAPPGLDSFLLMSNVQHGRVAVLLSDNITSASEIDLLDTGSLSTLRVLPDPGWVTMLHVTERGLLLATVSSTVSLWETTLTYQDFSSGASASTHLDATPRDLAIADDELAIVSGRSAHVFRYSAQSFNPLSAPEQGSNFYLVRGEDEVIALGGETVRQVDLSLPQFPTVRSGATFLPPAEAYRIAGRYRHLVRDLADFNSLDGDPSISWTWWSHGLRRQWLDLSDPGRPTTIATATTASSTVAGGWHSGAYDYAVLGQQFLVVEPGPAPVVLGRARVSYPSLGWSAIRVDDSQHRVLGATRTSSAPASRLLLFDVSNPRAPALIAESGQLPGYVTSTGIAGDLGVTFDGASLHVFDLRSSIPIEQGQVQVPGASLTGFILLFDGFTAIVTTDHGIAYVAVDAHGTPSIRGTLDTPEPVITATVVRDKLILSANSELMVVDGPCP